jgi:hypothetical protein
MFTLTFGKHKGMDLDEVPISYVLWMCGNRLDGTTQVYDISSFALNYVKKNHSKEVLEAGSFIRRRCWHCGEKLTPIDNDWDSRVLHGACYYNLK